MPAGRPTKYSKDFHCADYIKLCEEGLTLSEILTHWNIHHDTFYEWQKKHVEFTASIKEGNKRREAWWIQIGKKMMMEGKSSGSAYWIFFMKNVCKWQDKSSSEYESEAEAKLKAEEKINKLSTEERIQLAKKSKEKK
jgi:hypothetical protein